MKNLRTLFLVSVCALLFSCEREDDPTGVDELFLTAKSITSFEINSYSRVVATIEDATIKVELRMGTDASSLRPTISISDGATISPADNVAQDFTKPVTYTVTAKDGSTKVYTVIVTARETPSFLVGLVNDASATEFEGYLYVSGSNFEDVEFASLVLTDASNNEFIHRLPIDRTNSNEAKLAFRTGGIYRGTYTAVLHIGTQHQQLKNVTVRRNKPVVTNVGKYKFTPGEYVTIAARYLKDKGNRVRLDQWGGGSSRYLDLISESEYGVVVKLPEDISVAEYVLQIEFVVDGENYEAPCSLGHIFIKDADSTEPEITSIDRRVIKPGQIVTINGLNLKKEGKNTSVILRNHSNQTEIVRTTKSNEAGNELQFTIPNDLPPASFDIWVVVGEESSNAMTEIQGELQ